MLVKLSLKVKSVSKLYHGRWLCFNFKGFLFKKLFCGSTFSLHCPLVQMTHFEMVYRWGNRMAKTSVLAVSIQREEPSILIDFMNQSSLLSCSSVKYHKMLPILLLSSPSHL